MPDAAAPAGAADHAGTIAAELDWLAAAVEARLTGYFEDPRRPVTLPPPPALAPGSALAAAVSGAGLTAADRLILALALAPQVQPGLLDPFFVRNSALDRPFTIFGGAGATGAGFRPSGETALFLLAGDDCRARVATMARLAPEAPLRADLDLHLEGGAAAADPAPFAAPLTIDADRVLQLTTGRPPRPDFGPGFPAKRLTTGLDWADLVLPTETRHEIDHLLAWLDLGPRLLADWGLARSLAPGFRALFHGPPGTGKTLTAALVGKRTGRDVYRVDLSQVVSKYIGETEKNLAGVFDRARRQAWILFFDEADALFGARSATAGAHDRYANQEVAYLLQRIEDAPGVVILATNLRANLDDAFFRRFQAVIGFPRPDAAARAELWRVTLGPQAPLAADVDLAWLAASFDFAGGAIANAVRHAALTALRRDAAAITMADLRAGAAHELRKEGRL